MSVTRLLPAPCRLPRCGRLCRQCPTERPPERHLPAPLAVESARDRQSHRPTDRPTTTDRLGRVLGSAAPADRPQPREHPRGRFGYVLGAAARADSPPPTGGTGTAAPLSNRPTHGLSQTADRPPQQHPTLSVPSLRPTRARRARVHYGTIDYRRLVRYGTTERRLAYPTASRLSQPGHGRSQSRPNYHTAPRQGESLEGANRVREIRKVQAHRRTVRELWWKTKKTETSPLPQRANPPYQYCAHTERRRGLRRLTVDACF